MLIKTIYQGKTPIFEVLKNELGQPPIRSEIRPSQKGKYGVRFSKEIAKLHFPHIDNSIIFASDSIEDIVNIMQTEIERRRWQSIDFEEEWRKGEWKNDQ